MLQYPGVCVYSLGNSDSRWTRDFWSKSVLVLVFRSLHSWGVSRGITCGCCCWLLLDSHSYLLIHFSARCFLSQTHIIHLTLLTFMTIVDHYYNLSYWMNVFFTTFYINKKKSLNWLPFISFRETHFFQKHVLSSYTNIKLQDKYIIYTQIFTSQASWDIDRSR